MAVRLACPRDNLERSGIDLAVETPDMDRYDGLRIELDFEDEAPTLLAIDLLRWEEARSIFVSRSGTRGSWLMNERALRHLFDDLGRSLDRFG